MKRGIRTVVLKDGTEFVGKRLQWDFWEGWGEVTYRILSSNRLPVGSKVRVRLSAISYIVIEQASYIAVEPKGK